MTALLLQREIDDLVVRLKRLVMVRSLLESYGASAGKFSTISEEIARVRDELAQRGKHWATGTGREQSRTRSHRAGKRSSASRTRARGVIEAEPLADPIATRRPSIAKASPTRRTPA
jgi:hypothetical protein